MDQDPGKKVSDLSQVHHIYYTCNARGWSIACYCSGGSNRGRIEDIDKSLCKEMLELEDLEV